MPAGSAGKRGRSAAAREDEAALLGCLLQLGDEHARMRKEPSLLASDFREPGHRAVFIAISTLTTRGYLPEHEAVLDALVKTQSMPEERAEQLIRLLIARAPRQLHVLEYARRVRARRGSGKAS
jgi:replicative DNA helicase